MFRKILAFTLLTVTLVTVCAIVPAAAAEDKTEVVLWNRIFEDWNRAWCEQIVEEFNADPGQQYFITQEFVDGAAFDEKIAAARVAGTAPDMLLINYSNLIWAAQQELILPTDGLISQEAYDDLYDNVREMITFNGRIYGYPQMLEPAVVMYYRKDLLADAGFDGPPKTWDEYRAVAEALTDDDMFGATMTYDWSMWGWEYTAGGHWPIADDWAAPNCTDQGYVDLLNFIGDLYKAEVVPAQALAHYNESARLVADDSVAVTFSGSWGIGAILNDFPEMADVIGVAAAPTKDGSPFHSTVGGWTYQIDAKSKNPEGAAAFIEWLLADDPARAASFFEVANFSKYSPRKSVDDYLTTETAAKDNEWMQVISADIIPYGISEPIYAWDISAELLNAMSEVTVNNMSAEDALQQAADNIATFIANNDYANKLP